MALVDISTLQTIATGQPFLAATLQQIRDNQSFFANPPVCSIYNSAAQSVANDTATDMTADSETFDNDSMHSTASNTDRITIQTAGRYLFVATARFAADVDGYRNVYFRDSGATDVVGSLIWGNSASGVTAISVARAVVMSAGDYMTCRTRHTAGANLDVTLLEFAAFWMTE